MKNNIIAIAILAIALTLVSWQFLITLSEVAQ